MFHWHVESASGGLLSHGPNSFFVSEVDKVVAVELFTMLACGSMSIVRV